MVGEAVTNRQLLSSMKREAQQSEEPRKSWEAMATVLMPEKGETVGVIFDQRPDIIMLPCWVLGILVFL